MTASALAAPVRPGPDTWLQGYRPLPGIPDELIGADGRSRAPWNRFLEVLAAKGPEELARRFALADRHIRDAGVSYRAPGESAERPWPLSHMPLLIEPEDWRAIEAGVVQRATLMEAILADLYGEGRLVRDGLLPAAAVTGSPDFLRPLVGTLPPGGRFLHLLAVDLGRGPDGRWWVLGDRAQAPSGAGYALENRLVLSRAFPSSFETMNVERLARFFAAFRDGLAGAAERSEPRIGLLTPGPYSGTYFEQAYLARYLGFLLVEGDDLVVRDGRAHVRTIGGLKRVDVLWRRVDGDWVDPLELHAGSRLGVPGLLEAVRRGKVVVANQPGSGVLESRALLGFLPALARRLLGEDLALPTIATWWCGQPREREEVLRRLDELVIERAHGSGTSDAAEWALLNQERDPARRARLARAIAARGMDYVGQEAVRLSTTPVWEDGRLVPRPFVLRVFAAATPTGWHVMPGGFCRIADRADASAVSMGAGARSADVWVLGEAPVAKTTLLPAPEGVRIRRIAGLLPSRAADNLLWLARYLERAEATLRVVRGLCLTLMDSGSAAGRGHPMVARLAGLLAAWGAAPDDLPHPAAVAAAALTDPEGSGALPALARAAQRAASTLRERLSPDAWQLIAELGPTLPRDPGLGAGDVLEAAERALSRLAALSGLASENMIRGAGWRFLDLGRRIERGINTCRFTRALAGEKATADDLDALLTLADSQITYRARYLVGAALDPVRDLVVLDPFNPRSVAFQAASIDRHLADLPTLRQDGMLEPPRRLAIALAAGLATLDAGALDGPAMLRVERELMDLAVAVEALYVCHGPHAARPEKLTGLA